MVQLEICNPVNTKRSERASRDVPFVFDHLFQAIIYIKITILIKVAKITSVKPPILSNCFYRFLRIILVSPGSKLASDRTFLSVAQLTSLRLVLCKRSLLALGLRHLSHQGLQIGSHNLRSPCLMQQVAFLCSARHSERMAQRAQCIRKLEKCQCIRETSYSGIRGMLTLT